MLALSTAWTPDENLPVTETMRIASGAGFSRFEIGISPNPKDVEDIAAFIDSHGIEIVSIHNVFSAPPGRLNIDRGEGLSSADADLREKTVQGTIETARVAERLGAKAVVIHAGMVEIDAPCKKQTEVVSEIKKNGWTETTEERIMKMFGERNRAFRSSFNTLVDSLRRVLAATSTVCLGIESRYHYHEIPALDELDLLFDKLESDRVFYWHDVGHCHMSELLGLSRQEDWLARYADRMLGIHLHDMISFVDHHAPGTGIIDFASIKKYLKPDAIKVLEVAHHGQTLEDILKGADYLKSIGIE